MLRIVSESFPSSHQSFLEPESEFTSDKQFFTLFYFSMQQVWIATQYNALFINMFFTNVWSEYRVGKDNFVCIASGSMWFSLEVRKATCEVTTEVFHLLKESCRPCRMLREKNWKNNVKLKKQTSTLVQFRGHLNKQEQCLLKTTERSF